MLVQLATTPGRDDRPNEDFPAALPDCAVLLDGYWITSADPAAASHANTGMEDLDGLRSVTLLSDGATRFVEFSLGDWRELLALLGTAGISGVFDRIRAAEAGDPDGARWPRAKRHDDAAVVYLSSPELAWHTM